MQRKPIQIAIVDDHHLFRKGVVKLVQSLSDNFKVILEASNGQEFLKKITENTQINLVIIDLDMPVMNGFELAEKLKQEYPDLNTLALTMHSDDDDSIIRMIKSGVKGYLGKDIEPSELKEAIETVSKGDFFFNKSLSGKLLNMIISEGNNADWSLNDRELQFVTLCCSELTYKEIADKMFLSPKTIDGYRASLFERFNTKSRVGLVLLAIKKGWVDVSKL